MRPHGPRDLNGGGSAAAIYALIGTATLDGAAPEACQAVFRNFGRRRAKPTTPRPTTISA